MNSKLTQRMEKALARRAADGLLRTLKVRSANDSRINLADNDYLNLSHDPEIILAATSALKTWELHHRHLLWSLDTLNYTVT
jgi:7-keto-8-aminopelargonate synthetase-like enzyme